LHPKFRPEVQVRPFTEALSACAVVASVVVHHNVLGVRMRESLLRVLMSYPTRKQYFVKKKPQQKRQKQRQIPNLLLLLWEPLRLPTQTTIF
jgi:hypothetical protein